MKTRTTLLALVLSGLSFAAGEPSKAIPFDQLGAAAEKQSPENGTGITPNATGAKLKAVMQDLEAEATPEGLWLTSTADEDAGKPNHFRIRATSVGREGKTSTRFDERGTVRTALEIATFLRPGLTEEYSVSTDGVRQDFLVHERPAGTGELSVDLQITGAKAEAADFGAKLTVDGSGRELAYSRLKVTDATGRELFARMVVDAADRVQVVVEDTAAAYPVRVDPTFSDLDWISMGQLPGTNYWVNALASDASGNIYVGGDFTQAGGVANTNYIAKWNGSAWSAMGTGVDASVSAIAVSGTDVYVGGNFSTAGGVSASRIAKWNGSAWSALGTGTNSVVSSIAVSGANVYAGGFFTSAGGLPNTTYIARWNGTTWNAMGTGANDLVYALAVSGTDLYVGGRFTLAGGVANTARIAKWNGSVWSALSTGISSGDVYALAVSGMDLYVGGFFSGTGHIQKWNGSAWSALGGGLGSSVYALTVSGSDVYAGGEFTTAGGVSANRIAKWNGSIWSAVGTGTGSRVTALAVSGTDLYIGGTFTEGGGGIGGVATTGIGKWNGSAFGALGAGANGVVRAVAVSGSDLYMGGEFTTAGGTSMNRIAKWDGSNWSTLSTGIAGFVYALAADGAGNLYVGGVFSTAGGVANTNGIAKWNGSAWSALGTGVSNGGFSPVIHAIALSGTDLYAGGEFTTAGGVSATRIAKWNGSAWSALGTGVNDTVFALAISGSDLYAGGEFGTAGGVSASFIAKWNGIVWSSLSTGVNNFVKAVAVSGSDLFVGGDFTTAGGLSAPYIAKWSGGAWSSLGASVNGSVNALAASAPSLFVGGSFTAAGGVGANRVAMWNGVGWTSLGSGTTGTVNALALTGLKLYVGGAFSTPTAGGSAYIVQADVTSIHRFALRVSTSGSGTVNINPLGSDFAPGTLVTLTAVPAGGNVFTGWSGDAVSLNNPITITMDRLKAVTAVFGPPLSPALDTVGMTYYSGGTAPWFGQTTQSHDGVDAARSGAITHNQESWFETTVTGPGLLSFWWRVSSEANYDFLEFYIDGALQNGRISGESGWQLKTFTIFTGTHTLRWRYAKDKSGSSGTDSGFVDEVNWSPDGLAMPLVLDQYGIPFTRGGTTPWFGESTISHDGVDAAQSGAIDNNQQTWLQALAVGPGTISFWWKVSSEVNYDFLEFYINDVLQTGRISGEVDWQQQTYSVLDGASTFRWVYSKDRDTSAGLDTAWLDQVVWTTSVQSSFAAWSTNYFSAVELAEPLVSGPNANADGDSLVNLLEFALGGNPKQGNSAPVPVLSLSPESKPQLTFSCDTSRTGITYRVQYSTDFATWNDIATSVNGGRTLPVGALSTVSDTATGIRNVTVTYQNSTTTQPTVFLRLTVNQP